jgi:hypothetical protein
MKTMQRRSSKNSDGIAEARRVVEIAIGGPLVLNKEKNPFAVGLGKLGGQKGGKARAAALSPSRRRAIARKAAKARWSRKMV